jgi:predicted RNA-binding Zn-ribbon protein involved in translation (DUF1610 family)
MKKQTIKKVITAIAFVAMATIAIAYPCTYCGVTSVQYEGDMTIDLNTNPWTVTQACPGAKKTVYDPSKPDCKYNTDGDHSQCVWGEDVTVNRSVYSHSGSCGSPNWVLNVNESGTETCPSCGDIPDYECGQG